MMGCRININSGARRATEITESLLVFQKYGCRFSYLPKKLEIKFIFVQKLRVKNQILEKSVGAKSKSVGAAAPNLTGALNKNANISLTSS